MDDRREAGLEERIRASLKASIQVKQALLECSLVPIVESIQALCTAFRAQGKLLLFGNGGSAADAQHIAAEFVNRFQRTRRPLPALALSTDTSVLTSIANDDAFESIFSRQVRGLGRAGDVAWGITTSGRSENVIRGLQEARDRGLVTIGMTGGSGGRVDKIVDHWIHVGDDRVPRVQEAHITIAHIICELVEEAFSSDAGVEDSG